MEANKTSAVSRLLSNSTVRNICLWAFSVFASVFTFAFLACYVKAMTGGSWKVPLIVSAVLTLAGMCLACWVHYRDLKKMSNERKYTPTLEKSQGASQATTSTEQ